MINLVWQALVEVSRISATGISTMQTTIQSLFFKAALLILVPAAGSITLISNACADGFQPYTVVEKNQFNTFTGKGVLKTKGITYIGEMKDGLRHGYGVSYDIEGDIVAGHWVDDELQGEAVVITVAEDTVSAGEFKQGKLTGQGVKTQGINVVEGEFNSSGSQPQNPNCFQVGSRVECSKSPLLR